MENTPDCCWCECLKNHYILTSLFLLFICSKVCGFFRSGKSLQGDVAFITGGANGIGRQMALKLASQGVKVVIADLDGVKAKQVAQEITDVKQEAMWIQCDVTSVDSVNAAAKAAKAKFGNVSILINNAGIVNGKPITELSVESIERTFKVNAISHFYTIKAFLPDMLAMDKGHIVTIASIAGHGGVSKMTDYCASKFAAVGLDESLRNELKELGSKVTTTCVSPYYINTGMFAGVTCSYSFLLPMLDEDWVSGRIIKAIKFNEPMLVMPNILYLAMFLKGALPVHTIDKVGKMLGFQKSMNTFKGRN